MDAYENKYLSDSDSDNEDNNEYINTNFNDDDTDTFTDKNTLVGGYKMNALLFKNPNKKNEYDFIAEEQDDNGNIHKIKKSMKLEDVNEFLTRDDLIIPFGLYSQLDDAFRFGMNENIFIEDANVNDMNEKEEEEVKILDENLFQNLYDNFVNKITHNHTSDTTLNLNNKTHKPLTTVITNKTQKRKTEKVKNTRKRNLKKTTKRNKRTSKKK